MRIDASNELLEYSGRIDFSDKNEPLFIYPCSYVRIRFRGKKISATIKNYNCYWNNFIGVICDGKHSQICVYDQEKESTDDEEMSYVLAENLNEDEHEIILFKRQDACHVFRFLSFEIEAENGSPWILGDLHLPNRRIEVYGDSVSAGEVSEAVEFVGKEDPDWQQGEFSNSYYSYSWILARKLNAQLHDIAQGGMALLNDTGWFQVKDWSDEYYMGMEYAYDKLNYNPAFGQINRWDFKKYIPHIVIIAIGQNDSNPEDYMKEDYNCEKAINWRDKYQNFVTTIRSKYPKAHIILTTTILNHHENWDKSIEEVTRKINDEKVHHFMYSKNGKGTPGHIRISEAEMMADEIYEYINSLGESVWED